MFNFDHVYYIHVYVLQQKFKNVYVLDYMKFIEWFWDYDISSLHLQEKNHT